MRAFRVSNLTTHKKYLLAPSLSTRKCSTVLPILSHRNTKLQQFVGPVPQHSEVLYCASNPVTQKHQTTTICWPRPSALGSALLCFQSCHTETPKYNNLLAPSLSTRKCSTVLPILSHRNTKVQQFVGPVPQHPEVFYCASNPVTQKHQTTTIRTVLVL